MPTVNTASPRATKPAAKQATSKRAGARARTTTGARTANGAGTAARGRTSQTGVRNTPEIVGGYAERAVLIPVGAALIARERVVSGVSDALSVYSSPTKTQSQLRRFERRGSTARNRLEREVRKTRTRVERELRQRRQDGSELVSRLQERVLSLV
ncbi:MAG TPA: hypothetical protein VID29_01040 [Solirubrobacteraceae bacterium]|jgi:hypothetical protein